MAQARQLFVLVFIGVVLTCVNAAPNKITSLPGLIETPNFAQYAGYITVNATLGKNYYYWFVESQNDPANDPVLLWMQGGPGCSGLLGFWTENGPFRLNSNGTVSINALSWNRNANVIYLEQPAAVGFSYSTNPAGYTTNDNQTAVDNYDFLTGWFNEFPQYAKNELWLTGESYAGVYIPTLANQILDQGGPIAAVFQGFMLGNPVFHCPAWVAHHQTVIFNNWYYHGLISYSEWRTWFANNCNTTVTAQCDALYAESEKAIGPYDSDDLYTNWCTGNASMDFMAEVPSCLSIDDLLASYLNRPDVQQAIYANPPVAGAWEDCTSSSLFNYTQLGLDMIDFYNIFFAETNWSILIYSGDVDISTCPHPYAQLCLSDLARPIVKRWSRWTVPGPYIPGGGEKNNITAGYQEIYDKYSYATVRGAGHEVPTFEPWFAYNMYNRFIINRQNL